MSVFRKFHAVKFTLRSFVNWDFRLGSWLLGLFRDKILVLHLYFLLVSFNTFFLFLIHTLLRGAKHWIDTKDIHGLILFNYWRHHSRYPVRRAKCGVEQQRWAVATLVEEEVLLRLLAPVVENRRLENCVGQGLRLWYFVRKLHFGHWLGWS